MKHYVSLINIQKINYPCPELMGLGKISILPNAYSAKTQLKNKYKKGFKTSSIIIIEAEIE